MASRYGYLTVYSALIAAIAAAWLARELPDAAAFPPFWAAALCIGANLLIWHFGLTAPRVVLTSLERLPQIGILLVFEPAVAAAICAAASLLWPFVSRGYNFGSLKVATIRGLHNAGMTALMLLIAGKVYLATGGHHPLDALTAKDLWPLAAMALAAQAVNVALMALFYVFDRRDVRRLIRPIYSLMDLVFVPAGVLAALLYNADSQATFALFVGLMVVFVLCFSGIGGRLDTADSESGLLARLWRAGRALHGVRRIDELGERILTETRALFRFDGFYFVLVDQQQGALDIRVQERNGQRLPARRTPLASGLFGWAVENRDPVLIENWKNAPPAVRQRAESTEDLTGSFLAAPLIHDGAVIGLLSVQHSSPGVYSSADLELMQHLAEQVSAAIADARAFEDLQNYRQHLEERVAERTLALEQANRDKEVLIAALDERSRVLERESQEDSLTGIANRRYFDQRLAAEIETARAAGRILTLAVADLDHFKRVNDRLGHAVGDQVLQHAADLLRRQCGATDLAARIGGEEFALLLPDVTLEGAAARCEVLRHRFESYDWRAVHPHLRVTLSIGIAQWDGHLGPAALLQSADSRLYQAKNAGRNQVA